MNNYYFFLLLVATICFFYTEVSYGKWVPIDSTDQYEYIYLTCSDTNNCMIMARYINGMGEFIFRTTNGGNDWETVYADTLFMWHFPTKIYSISYPSNDLCYLSLDSGIVLKSTDQGNSWNTIYYEKNTINIINMKNEYYGLKAVTYDNDITKTIIYYTKNSGNTWHPLSLPVIEGFFIFDTYTIDDDILFICLSDTNNQLKHFKTENNGLTWHEINCPHYYDINFVNKDIGWICSDINSLNCLYKTTDGGLTWNMINDSLVINKNLGFISNFDKNNIVVSGNNYYLVRSTDGGNSWFKEIVEPYSIDMQGKEDLCFDPPAIMDENHALMLGFSGLWSWHYVYKYIPNITSIRDNNELNEYNIFPNPAITELNINLSNNTSPPLSYQITDLLGKTLQFGFFKDEGYNNTLKINIEKLKTGVYFINLIYSDRKESGKFVKE